MQGLPVIKFMYSNLYSDTKNGSMETAHEIMTRLKFIGKLKNFTLNIKYIRLI